MKNRIVKLGRRLNALPGNMENMAAEAVTASARRAAASARNMVPVDSGELKNSIAAENTHRLAAVVSAGAAHAAMVEFGTSRMAARPYMQPSTLR